MVYSINPSDPHRRVTPNDLDSLGGAKPAKSKTNGPAAAKSGDEVVLSSAARDIQLVKTHLGDVSPERHVFEGH